MKFPIGFTFPGSEKTPLEAQPLKSKAPVKSLVQIRFPAMKQLLTYFNDQFDLKPGDFVFVSGKMEGIQGIVCQVSKNFKIKVADYQKVISVADTDVSGRFHMAGSHFVTFDGSVLPNEKVRTWFLPPAKPEEEYETGNDGHTFLLENLENMNVSPAIWERGREYYLENRVHYVSLYDGHGMAIVEGEHIYEVEFDCQNGQISNLYCDCPCGYTCKHAVAAMMQLKETLDMIGNHYADLCSGYFAAVLKVDLFRFAVDSRITGSFIL